MILKTLNGTQWVMLDGINSIRYERIPPDVGICVREDVLDFTLSAKNPTTTQIGGEEVAYKRWEIWFGSNMKETQMLAVSPVYIMNDLGKTVETL